MIEEYKAYYNSPIGILEIIGTNQGVSSILFCEEERPLENNLPPVMVDCLNQMEEYFKGKRKEFTFKYTIHGTPFQQRVWDQLCNIPYGETSTYKVISEKIGNVKALRAVGNANGKNKLSIVVPCHRIIGSNGTLTGYAGGLWRKEWLLKHEKEIMEV
ncbi:methylated-DNA--[protein]-cysteine S-methyltransferase [Peribacillus alkalitolerans]|uniref:methylated-DNA--[protein]-cysteine S-methyltransferase n=1 Tax=Peribacillus alkalitolerans TaxID=1550385 RepID=UPI0013D87575|nr:methylated-DNA--[protein]-cysteine S-methyltransferase [Peribacillus alkalitolerans]